MQLWMAEVPRMVDSTVMMIWIMVFQVSFFIVLKEIKMCILRL